MLEKTKYWQTLVEHLNLQPHPEGGYYRETFRSDQQIPFNGGMRCASTVIYYLLAPGAYSAWHRIDADETWYFHTGCPVSVHVLSAQGDVLTHRLGNPIEHAGAVFQATVPAGRWFAAELSEPDDFALLSCSVAPGFEFSGFELAGAADMDDAAQQHGEWVTRLLVKARHSRSANPSFHR
ncbi:cupin domain-containing protein [Alcaligenaceae bacterium CGII-47]|nr:cupin domain-containing protein [Alcaligenaceae bacterium CGII-47]